MITAHERIDKARVLAGLRERLEQDLAVAVEAQRRTQSGATHEESRPENDKDTRALESSYLARGQARRVLELGAALASVRVLTPQSPLGRALLGQAVGSDVEVRTPQGTRAYRILSFN